MRVYLSPELAQLVRQFVDSKQETATVKVEGEKYYEIAETAESETVLALARGKLFLIRADVAGDLFGKD